MNLIENAKQLRQLIEMTSQNLTDEQAVKVPSCFPIWKEGIEVKEGERYVVKVDNSVSTLSADSLDDTNQSDEMLVLFRCTKTHTTSQNNSPEESEKLWQMVEEKIGNE